MDKINTPQKVFWDVGAISGFPEKPQVSWGRVHESPATDETDQEKTLLRGPRKNTSPPMPASADHSGHRNRIRERLFAGELPCGTDDEILEVLLFYAIPRGDTRPIAEALIDKFGSLRGVANATKEQLTSVKGVGEKTAIFLQTAALLARKTSVPEETVYLNEYEEKRDFFCGLLSNLDHEEVWAACLSEKGQLLDLARLSRGSKAGAHFSHRVLLTAVLNCGAAAVILVHNHPDGSTRPSSDDVITTRVVSGLLAQVACRLEEHILVAGERIVSIR